MSAKKWITILLAVSMSIMFNTGAFAADPIKVTFLVPDKKWYFWADVASFMEAAAEDLNMELTVVYTESGKNRFATKRLAESIVQGSDKPDYLVTVFLQGIGEGILSAAEAHQVKTFMVNANVPEKEKLQIGTPRTQFKHWIGHMYPTNHNAGYNLAEYLTTQAQAHRPSQPVKMIGFGGPGFSTVAVDRNAGVKQYAERDDVTLSVLAPTDWDRELAYKKTFALLKRHPDTQVIWTGSDGMALGAMKASQEAGRSPGKDIFIGGIDWTPEALVAVKNGKLSATIGGHFMEGGWIMVLLHDYHHGKDFAEMTGLTIVSDFKLIHSQNAPPYLEKFGDQDWSQIDFRKFSRAHNPNLDRYNFELEHVGSLCCQPKQGTSVSQKSTQ